mmetsp:Transcript_85054/g.177760  ORF Transcript_85054/g.177760 Transcript_85054/m.177760 type:complete len:221 (-) Transcript_85054:215-877(-)
MTLALQAGSTPVSRHKGMLLDLHADDALLGSSHHPSSTFELSCRNEIVRSPSALRWRVVLDLNILLDPVGRDHIRHSLFIVIVLIGCDVHNVEVGGTAAAVRLEVAKRKAAGTAAAGGGVRVAPAMHLSQYKRGTVAVVVILTLFSSLPPLLQLLLFLLLGLLPVALALVFSDVAAALARAPAAASDPPDSFSTEIQGDFCGGDGSRGDKNGPISISIRC